MGVGKIQLTLMVLSGRVTAENRTGGWRLYKS